MTLCPPDFRPSRVKDNFNPISKDYFRALGLARLSGTETLLMFHALEQSWFQRARKGFEGEAKPFRFDVPALSVDADTSESLLYRGIKALQAKGLLVRADGGGYTVAKDYHAWTQEDGKTPLLTSKQLETARAAANSSRPSKGDGLTKTSVVADEIVTRTDEIVRKSDENVSDSDENVTRKVAPPGPPIEERARAQSLTEALQSTLSEPAPRGEREEASPHPEGIDPRAPHLLSKADRDELDRVAEACERYFPMREELRRVVSGREGQYRAWAYGPALEELRRAEPRKVSRAYFLAIVARISRGTREAAEAGVPKPATNAIGAAPGGWRPHNMQVFKGDLGIGERRARAAEARRLREGA